MVRAHLPIEEFAQTVPNLTAATANLFELISGRNILLYRDDAMRLAASRAVVVESSRGWRINKLKQAHKIDVIVALGMAALAATRQEGLYPGYDHTMQWIDGVPLGGTRSQVEQDEADREWRNQMYWRSILPPGHWS